METMIISLEDAQSAFTLDNDTGQIFWRERDNKSFNSRFAGKEAGTVTVAGYRSVCLRKRLWFVHRVVWLLHYGENPNGEIDHIDGNKLNNRIQNLRCVTHAQNMKNLRINSANKTGVAGVCFDNSRALWLASIRVGGKHKNLGRFATMADAAEARAKAEEKMGFHQNHGKAMGNG